MIRITLIGHDTRNPNLGVGALTVSDIEIIQTIVKLLGIESSITILIGESSQPSCVAGINIKERIVRPLRRPWDFFSAVRDSDVVIDISGGDSFADIYGKRRILQVLLQQYLVLLAGRPLVLAPQTVGPFSNPIWRYLAAISIRRSSIVSTRDDKSTAFLREMGIERDVLEASDVALRLPYDPPKKVSRNRSPRVGLNISGLLMAGGHAGKNTFGLIADYPTLIRDILSSFCSHPDGCELHLVSHVIPTERGGIEDDYQACVDLAAEFPGTIIAPKFGSPSEAKTYIADLDFFMGARMHSCIAAFSSGVPVVPMAYSRKFSGLFGTLGYDLTVDCTKETSEQILRKIMEAYENREKVAAQAKTALQQGYERLNRYQDGLKSLIESLS